MIEVAEKRIAIIASGSMPIIREIENFYGEVNEKIQENRDEYNTKKLPQLLSILRRYDKDSIEYEIYAEQIRDDRIQQKKFIEQQLARVNERQNLVLQSFLSSRDKILEQTGQITKQLTEGYLKHTENLLEGQKTLAALPNADLKQLMSPKT